MRSDLITFARIEIHHFWWSQIRRRLSRIRVWPLRVSIEIDLKLLFPRRKFFFLRRISVFELFDQLLWSGLWDQLFDQQSSSSSPWSTISKSPTQLLGMWKRSTQPLGMERKRGRRGGMERGREEFLLIKILSFRNPRVHPLNRYYPDTY